MAATLAAAAALAVDATFLTKVAAATISVARTFKTQAPITDPNLRTSFTLNQQLADRALAAPGASSQIVSEFAWILATVNAIDNTSTDATLVNAVTTAWPYVAGLQPGQ